MGVDCGRANRLLLWRTDDGGRTWRRPICVFDGHRNVIDHPSLAVDMTSGKHAGAVYAVWTAGPRGRFPIGSQLYFARSTDGGNTFGQAQALTKLPRGSYPAVPVANIHPEGGLHVLFTVGTGDPYHPPFRRWRGC